MKNIMNRALCYIVLIWVLMSCSKSYMQYDKEIKLNSKYGFQIRGGYFANDTISLAINGIKLLNGVIFPPSIEYLKQDPEKNYSNSFFIELDNKLLSIQVFDSSYVVYNFQEQKNITIEIVKNWNQKSVFKVNLNKGRFLYLDDDLFYGNVKIRDHIVSKHINFPRIFKQKANDNIDIDYSIKNTIIRLTQFKKVPVSM